MPDRVHFEKTAIGNRAPLKGQPGYGQFETVREYTASLSWAEQRAAGFAEIRQAMDNLQARGTPISEFDRARVEAQIDLLTKDARMLPSGLPDFCKPGFQNSAPQAAPEIPTPDQIQPLIDRHNQQSNARLPDARTVASWDGTTRSGTILDLGNATIAQHQGQGAYAIAGIQQDLNGQTPPNGQYATLQQGGGVQIPQQSLGRTLA